MKKLLYILLAVLGAEPAIGQGPAVWNQIPLTGPAAKIIAAPATRFEIQGSGVLPFRSLNPVSMPMTDLQAVLFSPSTFEQLYEALGGAYIFEHFSPAIRLQTEAMPLLPGLRLGVRLGNRFRFHASAQHFRAGWSGDFPLIVFSQNQSPSHSVPGRIEATAKGTVLETGLSVRIMGRTVQPFVEAGLRGILRGRHSAVASVGAVIIPLEINPLQHTFSVFGGGGLRWNFGKRGFAEGVINHGRMADGKYGGALRGGLGWRF